VTRLGLLVISLVVGAALALGAAFAVGGVLSGLNESPVNQQLYNYGIR
jgi:hypothetical protein